MKYGVCTWTFGDQPLVSTAKTLSEIGFDGVELLGDLSLYSASEAKTILSDNGLGVFSLTPTDADISHPDEKVRNDAVDYYYRLIEFASEFGQPLISCHGLVKRIEPIATIEEENAWLIESVQKIAERAKQAGLNVVFEVLNRYEAHQINNHLQALKLVGDVGADNLGVLLDAYHMNIEEANPAEALRTTGEKLWLYHTADSNREGIGYGHSDIAAQVRALGEIGYDYATILECNAPGYNPFTPEKAEGWHDVLKQYLVDSLNWFKQN